MIYSNRPSVHRKGWRKEQVKTENDLFQAETFLVDAEYPKLLDGARTSATSMIPEEQTMEQQVLSIKLFGMLTSWAQDAPGAVKLARSIQNQNGLELWRLFWREYHPEQTNKALVWRRCRQSFRQRKQSSVLHCRNGKMTWTAMQRNMGQREPSATKIAELFSSLSHLRLS